MRQFKLKFIETRIFLEVTSLKILISTGDHKYFHSFSPLFGTWFHPTTDSVCSYIYEINIMQHTCVTCCRENGMSYLCQCLKAYCKSVAIGLGRKEGRQYVSRCMAFTFWNVSKTLLCWTVYL